MTRELPRKEHPPYDLVPMADSILKKLLDSSLKATLAAAEVSPMLKFGATFVSEISSRWGDLEDDKREALDSLTQEEITAALQQIDFAARDSAIAASGTLRIEDLCGHMVGELKRQSETSEGFGAFAVKLGTSVSEILGLLEGIDARTVSIDKNVQELLHRPHRGSAEVEWPVFTVPFPEHTCFCGRDDILDDLRRSFVDGEETVSAQAISGFGGRGKTQTAVEYAHRHRNDYKAILWVKAASALDIRKDMANAAKLLKLPCDETDLADAARALKLWLERNTDWLLIFDNADEPELLKPFIPGTTEGHVLITSRASVFAAVGILNPIEIPLLSVEDAATFLVMRTRHDSSDKAVIQAARELADELGRLPLALEQAGAYIHELRLTFQEYLDRYRKRRLEFLERGKPAMGDYDESVATTWLVNFEEIELHSEASADLFRLTAFLDADDIPFELFLLGASATNSSLAKAISESDDPELALLEAIRPLTHFSLVTISRENESFSTYRLVQEAFTHRLRKPECRIWLGRAVSMVSEAFPPVGFENWSECQRLVSHAVVVAARAENLSIQSVAIAHLAHQAAFFLHTQARYNEAERLYMQSIQITSLAHSEQRARLATTLNNLAGLYVDMGRLAEAEPLFKRSLKIGLTVSDEVGTSRAGTLNNLAGLYADTGRYAEAERLYKLVLETARATLGDRHPHVATTLDNLAGLYRDTGRRDDAEPLFEESLEIRRFALGEQHPDFATSLNNLAGLCRANGRHRDAEPLFKRSLEIVRLAFGEGHPSFATSLNNLAEVYRDLGRHAEAEPLYKRALEIMRDALGEQHLYFAVSLNNLALLYWGMGRLVEAERRLNQVLEIRRSALRAQHPDVAATLKNLVALYRAMGRDDEADELEGKADP
jgi:tetratricopeptide (TPR) repeat protein